MKFVSVYVVGRSPLCLISRSSSSKCTCRFGSSVPRKSTSRQIHELDNESYLINGMQSRGQVYPSTGNLSSCLFILGRGVTFLMQLQFLAPVELFLSSWRVTVFDPGGINIFYLCSFPRCVVFHVYTFIKNGTFNHCGSSKDSNKWAKNETDMYMIMHMFNFKYIF